MKNLKEFLEKRWWQGVGGIAGLVALVLVILQFLGIVHISGLAVSITVNIILAIALALVSIRAIRWKRRGEHLSSRLEEIAGLAERQKEAKKRKRVLLPDPNCIWKLNIDNVLLNESYGQAYGHAVNKYHDAKLSCLAILVHPYADDRVSIHFSFYSKWADRVSSFGISEVGDIHEFLPDKPAASNFERTTFDELPWNREQNWLQFLKKSCEKVGPLSPDRWTNYTLSAYPHAESPWLMHFEDGVTGKEIWLDWDGKGDPMPREEFD